MPAKLRLRDKVVIRSGNTVDTNHVRGGDLKGCRAEIVSEAKSMPGPDGKFEERAVVAVYDDHAPQGAGFLSIPTRRLEKDTMLGRARACGISFDTLGRIIRPGRN